MWIFDCDSCAFTDEFGTAKSLPKSMKLPDSCPDCGGNLIKKTEFPDCVPDVPGAYDYTEGKKAWKKNLSQTQQADVLLGERQPY